MSKITANDAFESWANEIGVVRSDSYTQESLILFDGLRRGVESIDDALIEEFSPAVRFDARRTPGLLHLTQRDGPKIYFFISSVS